MTLPSTFTIQQFEQHRHELPDGGRWSELSAGLVLNLSPPTAEQGTVVMNLGKALAAYTQRERKGYACFELGFLLNREPATLRFPPLCFFASGQMFYETDKMWTERRPDLVVEIPSTSDRRRGLDRPLAPDLTTTPRREDPSPLAAGTELIIGPRSGGRFCLD